MTFRQKTSRIRRPYSRAAVTDEIKEALLCFDRIAPQLLNQ